MRSKIGEILCIVLLFSAAGNAQLLSGFGVKGGAVSAIQSWDYPAFGTSLPNDHRWGIDLGVFVEGLRLPYFSVLGEVHYIQKGFSTSLLITTPQSPDGTGEFLTLRPRLDYLSIPILAKLRFETGVLTPYIYAGPRFDIRLGHNEELVGAVYEKFKSTDVGASLGVGLELPLTAMPDLLVEFRYSPSFADAFKTQSVIVRNESFEILLGVLF